jgi:hypothetical protein
MDDQISRARMESNALPVTLRKSLLLLRLDDLPPATSDWHALALPRNRHRLRREAGGACTYLYVRHGEITLTLYAAEPPAQVVRTAHEWANFHRAFAESIVTESAYTIYARHGQLGDKEGKVLYVPHSVFMARSLRSHSVIHSVLPPGTWYAAYSPCATISSGGHFYLFDALHLTELARYYDRLHGATSAEPSCVRDPLGALVTIALSLTTRGGASILRRPTEALARMLAYPDDYHAPPLLSGAPPPDFGLPTRSLEQARFVLRLVMRHNGLSPEVAPLSSLTATRLEDWTQAGEDSLLVPPDIAERVFAPAQMPPPTPSAGSTPENGIAGTGLRAGRGGGQIRFRQVIFEQPGRASGWRPV